MPRTTYGRSAILALCLGASACTTLADASAGHVGCPADEIVIRDDRRRLSSQSWTAECRGRTYHCVSIASGDDLDVSCAPETQGGEAPARASSSPAPAVTPVAASTEAPAVSRSVRDGHPVLRATIRTNTAEVTLIGSPTREAERVYLTLELSADPSHRDCAAGLLVDGTAHPLSLHRHELLGALHSREKLSYIAPVSLLRQWVGASRTVGRICQEPLDFTSEHADLVREFLARFDEDLAWQSAQAPETVPAP